MEVGPPDPAGAGAVRVDEVHLESVDRRAALATFAASRSSSDDAVGPAPIERDLERSTWRNGARRPVHQAGRSVMSAPSSREVQAEVVAQRRPVVVGPEHAAFLEQRARPRRRIVEPVRREVGHEDVAVGGVVLDVAR